MEEFPRIQDQRRMRKTEDRPFIVLVGVATLGFALVLQPFFGAILWAGVIAIVFASLHARLLKAMKARRNLAAILAVFLITIIATVASQKWGYSCPICVISVSIAITVMS